MSSPDPSRCAAGAAMAAAFFRVRKPQIVVRVTHRGVDKHGRVRGRVGYVQRLSDDFIAHWGSSHTGRFAAWARRTVDGVEVCTPELFATYPTAEKASAHAKYAAHVPSLTLAELVKHDAARAGRGAP